MMDNILIREMQTDDIGEVARFHHAAWMDAYRGLLPEEGLQQLTQQHFLHTWEKIIDDEHRNNLVAIKAKKPIGYASYRQWKKPGRWELLGLYVAPAWMHKGCGTSLFNAVEKDIQQKNAKLLFVWVIKGNQRALQFYQKNGMTRRKRTRRIKKEAMAFQEVQLVKRFRYNQNKPNQ